MGNIGGGRIIKVCDLCGGVDDHPRHIIAGSVGGVYDPPLSEVVAKVVANASKTVAEPEVQRLIADLLDTSSQERHLDCCAEAGCPTGQCPEVMHAAGSRRGAALLNHIKKG